MKGILRALELLYSRSKIIPLPGQDKFEPVPTEELADILQLGFEETEKMLRKHVSESEHPLFYYIFQSPKVENVPFGGWVMSEYGFTWFEYNRAEMVKNIRGDDDGESKKGD